MRECVMNDSKLYTGPEDCYIHVEKAGDGPMRIIVVGDEFEILRGMYGALMQMEEQSGTKVKNFLNGLMIMNRKYKNNAPMIFHPMEDEAG